MRQWDLETISNIMIACIIMHNMIIEDERGLRLEAFQDLDVGERSSRPHLSFREMQIRTRELKSLDHHYALRNDLIDHLWRLKGQ